MRHVRFAILVLLLVPLGALAQSTQPSGGEPPHHHLGVLMRERQADVDEAIEFMHKHSPRRVAVYDHGHRMGEFMITRYRALRELKAQDPPLYDIKVHEVELEDKVFGLVNDYHENAGNSQAAELRSQLREAVSDLLSTRLSEREHRIDKAQKQLSEAEKALEADRAGLDAAVDKRMLTLLQERTPPTTAPSSDAAPADSSTPPEKASGQ